MSTSGKGAQPGGEVAALRGRWAWGGGGGVAEEAAETG